VCRVEVAEGAGGRQLRPTCSTRQPWTRPTDGMSRRPTPPQGLPLQASHCTAILEVWLGTPSTTMSKFTAPTGAAPGMTMLIWYRPRKPGA